MGQSRRVATIAERPLKANDFDLSILISLSEGHQQKAGAHAP